MPLTVHVNVNDKQVCAVKAWNRGHPDGGRPADDDLRRYEFESTDGQRGEVFHRRSHGAGALAAAILDACWTPVLEEDEA